MEQKHDILTVGEVAEWLRCTKNTVYKAIKAGKLQAFRMGSDWRFKRSTIEALINEPLLHP